MTIVGRVLELWRYPVKSMGGERLDRTEVGPQGIPADRGWALRDEAAAEIRGAKKLPDLLRCTARYRQDPAAADVPHADIVLPDGTTTATDDPSLGDRLSTLLGRTVTVWPRRPADDDAHYRRGLPDDMDIEREMRAIFGRLPDEPLPDFSMFSPEIMEFTSPRGTYFDVAPIHLVTTASLAAVGSDGDAPHRDVRRFRPNVLVDTGAAAGFVEAAWTGRRVRVGAVVLRIDMPTVRCVMTTLAQPTLPKDPSVLRTIVHDGAQNLGLYASVTQPGPIAVGDPVELLD